MQDIRQSVLLGSLFDPEAGGNMYLQKTDFSKLYDVSNQGTIPFIATNEHNLKNTSRSLNY
jgi:hypothetical protein